MEALISFAMSTKSLTLGILITVRFQYPPIPCQGVERDKITPQFQARGHIWRGRRRDPLTGTFDLYLT